MAQTDHSLPPNQIETTTPAYFSFPLAQRLANLSLSTKLIIAFLVVSVLSVAAMTFSTNYVMNTELSKQVGTNLKITAQTQAGRIDNDLAKQLELMQAFGLNNIVDDNLEALSNAHTGDAAAIKAEIENLDRQWQAAVTAGNQADPLIATRTNNDITVELNEFLDLFSDHGELLLTDKYGALAAAITAPPLYNMANEAWWQAAYNGGQGGLYISQPQLDETTQEFVVIMAVPVFAQEEDKVVGVFRSAYRLNEIVGILQEFGSRGGADLLVAGNKILREEGDIIALDEATVALLQEKAGLDYAQFYYDDGYSLVSQAPIVSLDPEEKAAIDPLGWVLILDEDPAQVLAGVNDATQLNLAIGLVVFIVAGLMALLVAKLLVDPITRLTSVARQITAGDLNLQAPVESQDEVGELGATFNTMVSQLHQTVDQVIARTKQIEVIVNVSQKFSAILDLDALMREVVTITKETFNFYHVHIYLLDERGETLFMAEGYGYAGAEMKRQGHQIPLNAPKSLVARAMRENTTITVENVRLNPDWLPNPLLPDTHAEMAVPVVLEQEIVGVLDVQSETVGGLTHRDEVILQLLANQIAIAVHNARLFNDTQTALQEAQKLQQLYTGQVWERFSANRNTDYEVRQALLPPLQEVTTPEAIAAWQRERTVALGGPTLEVDSEDVTNRVTPAPGSNPSALATPLKLHNKVVGVLGLHDENPNRHWTEDEIALIEAVSEQMSLAIENARLFEESQRSAWRDQVVSATTAKVWASSEIEEVMRAAVAQLGDRLRASEVVIRLGTEKELAQE